MEPLSLTIFPSLAGGVVFAIALFGCCGAWKENKCLIYTYGTILFFILIAQVGFFISDGLHINRKFTWI